MKDLMIGPYFVMALCFFAIAATRPNNAERAGYVDPPPCKKAGCRFHTEAMLKGVWP